MKKALILVVSLFVLPTVAAAEYPDSLFSVTQLNINSVRQPHGLNWYLQSREAQAIISSVSGYMGVDPRFVQLALNAVPTARSEGEETYYSLPVPSGYALCSTRLNVSGINPGSGDRASVLGVSVGRDGAAVYTWTPVGHLGDGRSWVEGDLQITGIKPAYLREFQQKGVCGSLSSSGEWKIADCRGNPCNVNNFGNLREASRTTPAIAEGM